MVERLKQIPARLLEFWNKYTGKQKTAIISVTAVVVLALGLLYFTLSRTQYVELYKFEDVKSASELTDLLAEEGIKFKLSSSGRVSVDSKKSQEALNIMGMNNLPAGDMDWDTALNNSMSTTETEKSVKFNLAFQGDLRKYLCSIDGVRDAVVSIKAPEKDYTIFAENQDTSVSVILTLLKEMSADTAKGLAISLATSVGNPDTSKITIIDDKGKVLFSGMEENGLGGVVNSADEFRQKLKNQYALNVRELLIADGYNEVQIGSNNIVFNFDKVNQLYTSYSVPEGNDEGYKKNAYEYSAKGNTGSSGIPGTESNSNQTDYNIPDTGSSNNEVDLKQYDYALNEKVENIDKETGVVQPESSSIAVVATKYVVYDQAVMEKDGTLNGLTWEQFVSANNQRTQVTPDDHVVALIAKCTGISENNIQVVEWQQPIFNNKISEPMNVSNILMIVLAVLIVALLIFVVFKGTAPVVVTELEPELSVEQLLATTKENQSLEDIEFSEMSETRKMIEKFVDENPEAVAQLLRNWLNDDWG